MQKMASVNISQILNWHNHKREVSQEELTSSLKRNCLVALRRTKKVKVKVSCPSLLTLRHK
uniref:Uncharacterized protein n=1 Tax=Rhizophora mucronata TaxID=61149 RepID=A0A2P2III0_RHIMU